MIQFGCLADVAALFGVLSLFQEGFNALGVVALAAVAGELIQEPASLLGALRGFIVQTFLVGGG